MAPKVCSSFGSARREGFAVKGALSPTFWCFYAIVGLKKQTMVPDAKSQTFVIKNEKENIKLILSGKVMRFKILQVFLFILAILISRLQKLNSVH